MKKAFSIITLAFLAVTFVRAQTAANNSQIEQELRKITNERISSIYRGDKTVFDRYLADNYVETSDDGTVQTKAKLMANFEPPPSSMKITFNIEDVQVSVYGDTAVMNFRGNFQIDVSGQKISESQRVTDVWMRRGGRWQLIAEHYSNIPAERIVAKVDPKIYDAYVGQYQLAPDLILLVAREDDKLMGRASTDQKSKELLAENETTFFFKGDNGKTIFVKDDKGQVTHLLIRTLDEQELKAKKIK